MTARETRSPWQVAEDIIYDDIAQHIGDLVNVFWDATDDPRKHDTAYDDGLTAVRNFVLEMMEARDAERIAGARDALARADAGGGAALEGTPIIIDGGVRGTEYGPKTFSDNS